MEFVKSEKNNTYSITELTIEDLQLINDSINSSKLPQKRALFGMNQLIEEAIKKHAQPKKR